MRKTVARRMTDSFRDVPHFPLTIDLEIDALLAARTKINACWRSQGVKVSVNDLVIKAAAVALKRCRKPTPPTRRKASPCTTTPTSPWRWRSTAA
jgi:pyruvate/2-oxoglutarate dehydrogenase complex dihydrolipoamide acyltransferase (E2) component